MRYQCQFLACGFFVVCLPHGKIEPMEQKERPSQIVEVVKDKIMRDHLLELFKPDIRDNYEVTEFVQLPSGDWVVRVQRTLESYDG